MIRSAQAVTIRGWCVVALSCLLGACAPPFGNGRANRAAPAGVVDVEWRAFASDPGGSRHSAASQIHPGNVDRLEVAWVYRTGDFRLGKRGGRFEATPLMVDGTLFLSTPFGRVIALDPATGDERWNFDPRIDPAGRYGDWANRGVTSWIDPGRRAGEPCRHRVFVAPIDARLIALDAGTGRELWSAALPAGGNASPMSYAIGGRQFVVIAAGGHDRMGTTAGDYVVAFALPAADEANPAVRPEAPLAGWYEGQLLVGDGRFPVSVEIGPGDGTGLSGTVAGAIGGPLGGRIEGKDVTVEVPFTLPAEGCTGTLSGRLQRANRGRMLVGPVRVSGQCSDGGEEEGVLALRRSNP